MTQLEHLKQARINFWAWRLDGSPTHWTFAMKHLQAGGGLVECQPSPDNASLLIEACTLAIEGELAIV